MSLSRWIPKSWKRTIRRKAGVLLMEDRLNNLKQAGFQPRKIIDTGAHRGDWTRTIKAVFPGAAVLMIEPLPECGEALAKIQSAWKDVRHRAALLGAVPGRARFRTEGTNSRMMDPGEPVPPSVQTLEIPVETLEAVAQAEGFMDCDLLKMDLQGHELEALKGAGAIFGDCEVIFMEVSWIRIGEVPILAEVIRAMGEKQYVPYDVMNFNYRPADRALWQSDLIFVKESSPLLKSRQWC